MADFAVIQDDKVINCIVAESKEIAENVTGLLCVEYTLENAPSIGFTWDGNNFIPPVYDTPVE